MSNVDSNVVTRANDKYCCFLASSYFTSDFRKVDYI